MRYHHSIIAVQPRMIGARVKLLVVNNISSGIGDGSIFDYLRIFMQDNDNVTIRSTDGTTDIKALLTDAADYDAVVVSGGDGTVAAATFALAYTGVPILPFPAGTANLLANNLHSPYEPFALAKMTRDMNTLDFDLGEIEAGGQRFGFGIMAGAGYDATIMHDAQPAKKFFGAAAYFGAAVANAKPQRSKIRLVIDGEEIVTEGLGILLVNFPRIQFEIPITHDSVPCDGSFEIGILKAENAFGLIPAAIASIRDRDGAFPDRTESVEIHKGRVIEAYADPPLQIQYDGEVPGLTTPFKARVLEGAARFILSGAGLEAFTGD